MKKKAIIFYALLYTLVIGQAQTAAGDIAFVGFNADNNDQFTIITTNYLEDGTQIYFVDAGWTGTAIYASEGGILWTVPSGGLPTNTMVTFTGAGAGGFTTFPTGSLEVGASVTAGTIAASGIAASMALTTSGDQILAFTGSVASPTFIAAANFNGAWSWTGTNNSEQSLLPPGLTSGTNCVLLSDRDNGKIDCLLLPDPASLSDYNNAANWVFNDAIRYTLPPTLGTCEFLLPLDLIAFNGYSTSSGNQLEWITANEIQVSGFEIQRSENGIDFSTIGHIQAIGTSDNTLTYQFFDDFLLAEQTYYRLKIIDLNDTFTYSNIIQVSNNGKSEITLFPNPVSDYTNIIFPNNCESVQIQLYTSTGSFLRGINIENRNNNQLEINTSDLPHGMFMLLIHCEETTVTLPFIK